jgi:acyl carrier protein
VTRDAIRESVLRILSGIAPEANLTALKPDLAFRDQLDIDSMDILNFVIGLDKELHVAVPETDYHRIATLNGCIDYLAARLDV